MTAPVNDTGVCAICSREGRGFHFDQPGMPRNAAFNSACSMACLLLLEHAMKMGDMPSVTTNERAAVEASMEAVGEAIEATGTTDLAQMTVGQFISVITATFTNVARNLREIADKDAVPF